jgi:hypothetical protein
MFTARLMERSQFNKLSRKNRGAQRWRSKCPERQDTVQVAWVNMTKRRRTVIWVTRTQRTKTYVTRKKEKNDWGDKETETMIWVTTYKAQQGTMRHDKTRLYRLKMTNDPDDKDNDDKVQHGNGQGDTAKEDIVWVTMTVMKRKSMTRLRITRIMKTRCSLTSTAGVKE